MASAHKDHQHDDYQHGYLLIQCISRLLNQKQQTSNELHEIYNKKMNNAKQFCNIK